MTIAPLREHPEWLETLATATGRAWAHLYPGWGFAAARAELINQDPRGILPMTFIAIEGGSCAGTVSVISDDLPGYRAVNPWLASLLVLPGFRGRGVAAALIRHAEAHLAAAGFPEVWLFTETALDLFARSGWELVESAACHGHPVQVMRRTLRPANQAGCGAEAARSRSRAS